MFKKTLPLIIASAAMAFFGCALTPKIQIPVQVNLNDNSGNNGNNSEGTDASTSDTKTAAAQETSPAADSAIANTTAVDESAQKSEKISVAATCEITKQTDTEFSMSLIITDSAKVDLGLSLIGNDISSKTNVTFSDKISDSTIASECEKAKKNEEIEVSCKNRNMSIVTKMVGVDASMYPAIAVTFQKSCENIQKTGVVEASK